MGDHASLRGPGGEGRPLVSLSKNFPPGMDLGQSCEPADSLSAFVGLMWDVCSLKKMRAENETGRGERKCVRVHSTTTLTIEHVPLLDCREIQIWCQISNVIT